MADRIVSRLLDGTRIADIRKTAQPGSDEEFLLKVIDAQRALIQQMRAEAQLAQLVDDYRDAGAMTSEDAA